MDSKLVGWARAVKRRLHGKRGPVLWLFTDTARLPDPVAAAACLPRGLCGVVLRDDTRPGRAALAAALARVCRARGNALVVAGDTRLARAVGAGVHLRAGHRLHGMRGLRGPVTSSAHGAVELRRAARAGAGVAFLSPAFATASHPGAPGLGTARWAALARRAPAGMVVGALGGIDGASVRRLPGLRCAAAIGALAP
ncbi:MAG: thiamine phosphate synthase [Alphaproteobacteria bacterium]|nr:thiamine phosphate synthase [Alphaproteobacteria bacterium]